MRLRLWESKVTTFSSFFPVNCVITFPRVFDEFLRKLVIFNLVGCLSNLVCPKCRDLNIAFSSSTTAIEQEIIPSLGLQCEFSSFDYMHNILAQTLGPIAVSIALGLAYLGVAIREKRKIARLNRKAERYKVSNDLRLELADEDLAALLRKFAELDEDGGGSIDKSEFVHLIKHVQQEATEEEVEATTTAVFSDEATIDFEGFARLVHAAHLNLASSEASEKLAELIDKDMAHDKADQQGIVWLFLLLTFLTLIGTSTTLFNFFKCDSFSVPEEDGGGTQKYLFKDYSVNCDTDRYRLYFAYAIFMVIVFPVGIPLTYAALLWRQRSVVGDPAALVDDLSRGAPGAGHLKFLIQAYRPEHFW